MKYKRGFYKKALHNESKPGSESEAFQNWYVVVLTSTVFPGFSVLGFRALPGFRVLCTGNQIWIYVINLPGFRAPFHGNGQSALNPGTTVFILSTLIELS